MYHLNVSKIKRLMAENNENITSLSKILKLHKNTLSKKLLNETQFTAEGLAAIANHYNIFCIKKRTKKVCLFYYFIFGLKKPSATHIMYGFKFSVNFVFIVISILCWIL